MAKSTLKDLRNLYGFLLGEDLVKKLSDDQVKLVSSYYESLSDKEKEKINDAISEGKSHDLLEMAQTLLEESKQNKKPEPKEKKSKVKKPEEKDVSQKNPPGALVKYEGTNDEDLVDEEIDERILKILGLEDSIGFDYGDYKTLLREKLTELDMKSAQKPKETSETQSVLINEFKRIKSKTGRFKVKSVKKISADKFIPKATFSKPKDQYLLTNNITTVNDQEEDKKSIKSEETSSLLEKVIDIKTSVDKILSLLSRQNSVIKKQSENERLDKQRKSRGKKEESLEKNNKIATNLVAKVIAPIQGILDKIINFFVWVILGRAVTKFLEWAKDPKNKGQVEALGNLLKNWWPAILGAFVLFTTPLGKFIRVVVGTVTKLTFQLLRKGIPALRRFLKDRNKKKNRITSDADRKKPRGRNNRVTQSAGKPGRTPGKTPRVSGRGGLFGALAFMGLEMATPFLSEKVGELYSNLKIGDRGLSDEDLLKEYQKEKDKIERRSSGPLGDLIQERTDYSRLEGLEQELNKRGIAYKFGGPIRPFSGVVSSSDGIKVSGAGPDTQAFAVEGGGTAVLKPGELVLNEQQQKDIQRDTGVDPKSYVADARPPQSFGIKRYNTGGIIGGVPQGPYTPLPSPGYVRPEGSFIPRPNLRGMPGPTGKPMPWGFNPFQGLRGGGLVKQPKIKNIPNSQKRSPKIDAMRLGAALINIAPIDTDLPRPMTGFRDLAEVEYRNQLKNNSGKVKGLQGGGLLSWWPFGGKKDPSKKAVGKLQNAAQSGNLGGVAQQLDSRRRATEEAMKMLNGYQGGGAVRMQSGGLFEGIQNFVGNLFAPKKAKATSSKPKTPLKPSWYGPAPLPDHKSPEVQALLRTIRKAEHYASTKNPYDTLYGGGTAPVTKMTVQEVIRMYDTKKLPARFGGGPANYGSGSGAAGAYQFMPFTLEDLIRRGAVKPNQIMTPDLQDRLGWDLASNVRGLSLSGLKKSGLTKNYVDMIAPEWASFPNLFGPDAKGRVGTNASYYGQPSKDYNVLSEIYKQSLPQKKIGGGLVKENTGMDVPGATADRQAVYLQPGEYVLPVDVVNSIGLPSLDKLVSDFDSNSNPAKIVKNVNKSIPGPRKSKSNGTKVLPPIQQMVGDSGMMPLETNGSEVPSFPTVSPYSERFTQMASYGILSVG